MSVYWLIGTGFFISLGSRRVQETFIGVGVAFGLYILYKWLRGSSLEKPLQKKNTVRHTSWRMLLLTLLSFVFGMEVWKYQQQQPITG